MPLFKSRSRSRLRPTTPATPCTTSCEHKPCTCRQQPDIVVAPLILESECLTKNCCCKKSSPNPKCNLKNCCCKKQQALMCEVKKPQSKCPLSKDYVGGSSSSSEQKFPPPFVQRGFSCNGLNFSPRSCEQPEPCQAFSCCSKSKPRIQTTINTPTLVKLQPKSSPECGRPGCSTKKPCITCCKRTCG